MSWPIVLDEVSKVGKAAATVQKAAKPKIYTIPFGANHAVNAAAFGPDDVLYLFTTNNGSAPFAVTKFYPKTGQMSVLTTAMPGVAQQVVLVGNLLYVNSYATLWSVNVETGAVTSLASIPGSTDFQQLIALDDFPAYLYLIDKAATVDQFRRYDIAANSWSYVTQGATQTSSSGRCSYYDGTYLYLAHQGQIDRYNPATNVYNAGFITVAISSVFGNAFYSSGANSPINGNSIFVRSVTRPSSSSAYLAAFGFRVVNGSTVELEVLPFDAIAHMWNTSDPSTPVRVMPYTQNGLYNPATDTLLLLESYAVIIYEGVKANAAGL